MTLNIDKVELFELERRKREERIRRYLDISREAPSAVGASPDVEANFKRLAQTLDEGREADQGTLQKLLQGLQPVFSFLEKVTLPFEATSSAIQGMVETAVTQTPGVREAHLALHSGVRDLFNLPDQPGKAPSLIPGLNTDPEARERAMDALRALFSGEVTPAQAAGLLREANRMRGTVEQLVGGILFDPMTYISPIALIKTGVGSAALKLSPMSASRVRLALPSRKAIAMMDLADQSPELRQTLEAFGEFPSSGGAVRGFGAGPSADDALGAVPDILLSARQPGTRQISQFGVTEVWRGVKSGEVGAWMGFGKAKLPKQIVMSTDPEEIAARHGIRVMFDASRLYGKVRTGKEFAKRWEEGIGDFQINTLDFNPREAIARIDIDKNTAKIGRFRTQMDNMVAKSDEWQKLEDDATGAVSYIRKKLEPLAPDDPEALPLVTAVSNRLKAYGSFEAVTTALDAIDTTVDNLGHQVMTKTTAAGATMTNKQVAEAARMRAILTILRNTAVRPTDAVNLTKNELTEIVESMVAGNQAFWFPRIKRYKGKVTGGKTPFAREVVVPNFNEIQRAIDDFLQYRKSITRTKLKDNDPIFAFGHANPEDNVDAFRQSLTTLRHETNLPLPLPAEIRPLRVMELFNAGTDLETIENILGHVPGSGVVARNYMRDFGLDVFRDYNLEGILKHTFEPQFVTKKVADLGRFKGAQAGKTNPAVLIKWGDDFIKRFKIGPDELTPQDMAAIQAGTATPPVLKRYHLDQILIDEQREIMTEAYQLEELQHILRRIREAERVVDVKINSVNLKDFPEMISDQNLFKSHKASLTNVGDSLEEYTRRKITQLTLKSEDELGHVPPGIRSILGQMQFGGVARKRLQTERSVGIAIGSKRATAAAARDLAAFIGERHELFQLETNVKASSATAQVKTWMSDSGIRRFLQAKGLYHNSDIKKIEKSLRAAAKTAPDMFGPDFKGLSATQREERIKFLTTVLDERRSLLEGMTQKSGRFKKPNAKSDAVPATGGAGGDDIPPGPFQRLGDEAEPSQPFSERFGAEIDIPDATELLSHVERVRPSKWAKDKAAALRQARVAGGFMGETFTRAIEWFGGGYAPFVDRAAQIALGVRDSYNIARLQGEFIASRLSIAFRNLDIGRNVFPDDSIGNEIVRTAGLEVKKLHPEMVKKLQGTAKWAGREESMMRELNFIFDLPVAQWDEYYKMTPEVKDTLLYAVHHIEELEKLAWRHGVDFDKIQGMGKRDPSRLNAYVPRIAVGRAGQSWRWEPRPVTVAQADTSFFRARKHLYYNDAVEAQVNYLPVNESIGRYAQAVYQLIAEEQAKTLFKDEGWLSPQFLGRRRTEVRSLVRYARAKTKGEFYVGMSDDKYTAETGSDVVRRLLLEVQKNPTKEVLDDVLKMAEEMEDLQEGARRARDLMTGGLDEVSYLKNFLFTVDEMKQLDRVLVRRETGITKIASIAAAGNQISRVLKAGLDVGTPLIFGLPMLRSPNGFKMWAQAYGMHMRALFSPDIHHEWRTTAATIATMREAAEHGVVFGRPEYFEILGSTSAARSAGEALLNLPTPAGRALSSSLRRAEAAFTMFQEYSRVSLWDSLAPTIKKNGESLDDLAAVINKMTGTYNQALSGVTPNMGVIQQSLLFFAPVYRRASMGIIGDLARGKVRRREAFKTLSGMFTAVGVFSAMSHIAGSIADGKDPFSKDAWEFGPLDPRSPEFMGARIPGTDTNIGIGGAFYSLVRLLTGVVGDTIDPERRNETIFTFNPRDQRIFKWLRGQSAPMTGLSIDLLTGRTYIGDPLRDDDTIRSAALKVQHSASQFLPFWVAWEGLAPDTGDIPQAVAEFGGLRSFPNHISDKIIRTQTWAVRTSTDSEISQWRANELEAGRQPSWRNLPVVLQQKLTDMTPSLQELNQKAEELDLTRGSDTDMRFIQFRKKSAQNRAIVDARLAYISAQFEAGEIRPRDFTSKIREANAILGQLSTNTQNEFGDVVASMQERRRNYDITDVAFLGDFAFDRYMTELTSEQYTTALGEFDYNAWRKWRLQFRAEYGKEVWDYVQRRLKSRRQTTPLIVEYQQAQEALSEYWTMHNTLFDGDLANTVDAYLSADNAQQKFMRANWPGLRIALRMLETAREQWRARHPQEDWMLVKFYDAAPRTQFAHQQLQAWKQQQALVSSNSLNNESLRIARQINPSG